MSNHRDNDGTFQLAEDTWDNIKNKDPINEDIPTCFGHSGLSSGNIFIPVIFINSTTAYTGLKLFPDNGSKGPKYCRILRPKCVFLDGFYLTAL